MDPHGLSTGIEEVIVAYDKATTAKQGDGSPYPTVKGETGAIFSFDRATCGCT